MGRSKALLSPGGVSFLERVARTLQEGGCDPVTVIVRNVDGLEADLARALGLEVRLNTDPTDGPISSLRTAIAGLPPSVLGLVWCPVDYPVVRSETVACLLTAFEAHPTSFIVPERGGTHGHPVLFPRSLFAALQAKSLAEGARTVVRSSGVDIVTVAVDDEGVLMDINTPNDVRRAFPRSNVLAEGSP